MHVSKSTSKNRSSKAKTAVTDDRETRRKLLLEMILRSEAQRRQKPR